MLRSPTLRSISLLLALGCGAIGCGDDDAPLADAGRDATAEDAATDAATELDAGTDAGTDAGIDSGPPGPPCAETLGLYADSSCETLTEGVLAYSPRFWLWSDATDKERFIRFPEGSLIDTTNLDRWVFPVGTKIWKTFSLDGRHLETRVMEKTSAGSGPFNWLFRTYRWNEAQDGVVEVSDGETNVLDTHHDIPSVAACVRCHGPTGGGAADAVLGFGTIQLAHGDTDTNLETLDELGLLSNAVPPEMGRVPGEPATVAALGYLHANCGHCHGAARGAVPPPGGGLGLWVEPNLATVGDAAAYRTAVRTNALWRDPAAPETPLLRIAPGNPDNSAVLRRMQIRDGGAAQMPQLATDMVHPEGLDAIRAWILADAFD